jgi:hypothetical protein
MVGKAWQSRAINIMDIPQGHALSDLLPPKFLPPTIHHLSVMPSYYESIMG